MKIIPDLAFNGSAPKEEEVMSSKTHIQWTDATWNPVTGCSKLSAGCAHCYIERTPPFRMAGRRFDNKGRIPLVFHEDRLDQPLRWKKPRRVFVNSLSDLFHEDVPFAFIDKVFAVMALAPRHTFQVLTKRPERMREFVTERAKSAKWLEPIARGFGYTTRFTGLDGRDYGTVPWPLPNVWLGVSAEDQKRADERIPLLLQTPAAVRFVSCEPLLGPVDLTRLDGAGWGPEYRGITLDVLHGGGTKCNPPSPWGLDWVIAGGESGLWARPMHPDWARSLRDQCEAAGVAFHFKQWGEWLHESQMNDESEARGSFHEWSGEPYGSYRVGKRAAGRLLDGREWDEYPEAP